MSANTHTHTHTHARARVLSCILLTPMFSWEPDEAIVFSELCNAPSYTHTHTYTQHQGFDADRHGILGSFTSFPHLER